MKWPILESPGLVWAAWFYLEGDPYAVNVEVWASLEGGTFLFTAYKKGQRYYKVLTQ